MAKILLAEDDIHLSESLSELIKLDGHDVTIARDGQRAWDLLQHEDFDILITDFFMPLLDGDTLVHNIEDAPELDELYVIVISGQDTVFMQTYRRINYLLHKPFEVQKILSIINAL